METLRDQLRDPIFRKWFTKPPKEVKSAAKTSAWFVYVQKKEGGKWQRAEVRSYTEGYRYIAKHLKEYHDMALSNKRQESKPPVVRDKSLGKRRYHFPEAPGHIWCTFCRRMTRFSYFNRHHALPAWVNSEERRCTICGIRLRFIKRYD